MNVDKAGAEGDNFKTLVMFWGRRLKTIEKKETRARGGLVRGYSLDTAASFVRVLSPGAQTLKKQSGTAATI